MDPATLRFVPPPMNTNVVVGVDNSKITEAVHHMAEQLKTLSDQYIALGDAIGNARQELLDAAATLENRSLLDDEV